MKARNHPPKVRKLIHSQIGDLSTRPGGYVVPDMVTSPKALSPLCLTAIRQWNREFSYRVVSDRYVFYGSLLLATSVMAGALTQGYEVLWRSAASLSMATVVIGLTHACLPARSQIKHPHSHHKRSQKTYRTSRLITKGI